MTSINEKISTNQSELLNALANSDDGKARHLLKELADLDSFKKENPEREDAPSYLELYCHNNPSNPECLIYED